MALSEVTDLHIYKTVDDQSPQPGQTIEWTVHVRNNGPDTALNVSVTELIPNGVTLIGGGSASAGTFSESDDTWMIGSLESGAVEKLTLSTVVDTIEHPISVRSTVHTDSHDCDLDDNTHLAVATPWEPTEADLHLTKTVDNAAPEVGSKVTWTVTISNDGPDTAWKTVVKDEMPDGLLFVSASDEAYDPYKGEWHVGRLKSGESAQIDVETHVDTLAGSEFVNIAVASSSTVDANPGNNTAEASINPVEPVLEDQPTEQCDAIPCACLCCCEKEPASGADLQISKLVSNPTPDYGSEVVWTIVVENIGPEDAENVVVNDSLPAGLEHVADSATDGEFDESLGIWSIGDLASGSSAVLQITTVAVNAEFAQVNIAMVSSDTEESDLSNNIAHSSIDAVGADLAIEKTVSDAAPDLGDTVTWTIDVVNNGPDAAENVVVEDALPDGVTFTDASSETYSTDTGVWSIGDLAAGESATLTIDVTVDDADGPQVNVASVSSDTPEINPDDNEDSADTDAVAADLELEKGVIPATATPGDVVTWELTLANKGPDDATGIVVEDVLPNGLVYLADSTDSTDFNPDTGAWMVGDLAAGSSITLDIEATVTATGNITNIAQVVASDQFDPDSSVDNDDGDQSEDDEASATLAVPSIIDLELSQTVSGHSVAIGDKVTFTIKVTNTSSVDATGVSVANAGIPDHVDAGDLTIIDAGDAFDAATGLWEIGAVAAGETVTLSIEATVNSAVEIVNDAQVQSADQDDVDSTPANNVASEDDQEAVSLTAARSGPIAIDDEYSVVPDIEPVNAVFMIDHSGSMGTLSDGPDKGSSLGADIPSPNGGITSRLQLVRDAVVDISEREQVVNVKVLGFDGSAGGADNISNWFDVSGSDPDTDALSEFLNALEPSGYTNYVEALEATIEYTDKSANGSEDTIPSGASSTNYYFLTDGNPLLGQADGGAPKATPTAADERAWQEFVDETFGNAYGIGFGPGITNFKPLEQVAHQPSNPDDPDAIDDPNVILASEADEIPAELYNLLANSVSGNVFENDDSGADGPLIAGSAVSSLTVAGTTYTYDGSSVVVSSGPAPDTTLLTSRMINTPTEEGGRLEFNFSNGNFEYFSPFTDTALQEAFQYTISDASSDTDSATLTINIEPVSADVSVASASTVSVRPEPAVDSAIEVAVVFAEPASSDMLFVDQTVLI